MKKPLTEATDQELQAELDTLKAEIKIRDDVRRAAKHKQAMEQASLVLKHVDALLELVPKHGPTSCSDEDPCNAERPCTRCQLLDVKSMEISSWRIERIELVTV